MKAKNLVLTGLGLVGLCVALASEDRIKSAVTRICDAGRRFCAEPVKCLDDMHETLRAELAKAEAEMDATQDSIQSVNRLKDELLGNLSKLYPEESGNPSTDATLQAITPYRAETSEESGQALPVPVTLPTCQLATGSTSTEPGCLT